MRVACPECIVSHVCANERSHLRLRHSMTVLEEGRARLLAHPDMLTRLVGLLSCGLDVVVRNSVRSITGLTSERIAMGEGHALTMQSL